MRDVTFALADGPGHEVIAREEEEEEEEESLFKADAVNEEDPERDRASVWLLQPLRITQLQPLSEARCVCVCVCVCVSRNIICGITFPNGAIF